MAKWRRGHRGGHIGPLAQAWAQYNEQEQTMAVSDAVSGWRTGTPEPGVVVEVWSWLRVTAAVWTGEEWRAAGPDGEVLRFISHWRPVAGEG